MPNSETRQSAHEPVSLRRMFVSMFAVGLLTVVAKCAVAGRDLLLARSFGTSDAADAFVMALLVPLFAANVFQSALHASMIPTFVRTREKDGQRSAEQLLRNIVAWNLVLLASVCVVLIGLSPWLTRALASGFAPDKLAMTRRLVVLLLPAILLNAFDGPWSGVLNGSRRFALVAFAPALTSLSPALLLWLRGNRAGIFAVVSATLLGYLLQTAVLGISVRRLGYPLLPSWQRSHAAIRAIVRQYAPMIAGTFFMWSASVVDQAMGSWLGSGSVAVLAYAGRIVAMVNGIGAVSISSVVFPHFSNQVAARQWAALARTIRLSLTFVVSGAVICTIALILLSTPIVRFVFQRGAFTSEATRIVALTQACYALQIPFFLGSIILVRLISALEQNRILMWGAAISLVTDIAANYTFMKHWGIAGIALSTSLVYLLSFLFSGFWALTLLREKLRYGTEIELPPAV